MVQVNVQVSKFGTILFLTNPRDWDVTYLAYTYLLAYFMFDEIPNEGDGFLQFLLNNRS